MKTIVGTGLSGLVGSKCVELLKDAYTFKNADLSTGVDILNERQVSDFISVSDAKTVIHFAAFTDTQKAFEQTGDKNGIAYKVNVVGTQNIANACARTNKHLIHISTAYVFDGKKEAPYLETDATNPIEWYGQTKAWAEEEVLRICPSATILRIDRPYRLDAFPKADILHKVMEKLSTNTLLPQFADTSWTPTSIEKFASICRSIFEKAPAGIFHATTEQVFSDYTFALWVKEQFSLEGEVKPGSLTEYLATHDRPYQRNTALDTGKLLKVMANTP